MKKGLWIFILLVIIVIIVLVLNMGNNDTEEDVTSDPEELATLDVDFEVPESAEVDETVELKATVTYGDELVTDADEVVFEVWLEGNEDDSIDLEAINHEDGTYTVETSFDADGIYEMYAHTTARELHTMPRESIVVGTGEAEDEGQSDAPEDHDHQHAEGFDAHFAEPENVAADNDTALTVHVHLDGDPLEDADVRYEIWNYEVSDTHEWVDAEEVVPGEYTASHLFTEAGTYHIMLHVENDEGLHEHEEFELQVNE